MDTDFEEKWTVKKFKRFLWIKQNKKCTTKKELYETTDYKYHVDSIIYLKPNVFSALLQVCAF